jgi:hypothetical protein
MVREPGSKQATLDRKLKVLRRHCEAVGRDYDDIEVFAREVIPQIK